MQNPARSLVRRASQLPVLGRFVRIAVVAWESPNTVQAFWEHLSRIDRVYALQLPSLIETLSDLNHRDIELSREQKRVAQLVEQLATTFASTLSRSSEELNRRINDAQLGLGRHNDSIQYLLGRVEFVRRELMFEMRHGARPANGQGESLEGEPKVVSVEKLAAARKSKVRLNLGCGHICLDGFLNVDRRELPGVDIVADAGRIPVEPGAVDEIFSAHMLEHFPQEQLRRELLPYWKSLLKPTGIFRAVVPDAEAMIREYGKGHLPYDDLREVTFGAQDYDGDFHYNMFTPDHLSQLLAEAGFNTVRVVESGRRNGKCFEFEIVGAVA